MQQLIILLICVIVILVASNDATVGGTTGATAAESQVTKAQGPPSFFLQDPTDGLCLGGEKYRRCSIDTLWYVTGKPGSYSIHHRLVDEDDDDNCLGKAQCHLDESAVQLANCGHCGSKKWNIAGDNDSGFILTQDGNKNCLKRVGENAMVMKCDKGSSRLSLQCTS